MRDKVSKEQLQEVVCKSSSIGETLRNLGYDSECGSRYPWIKRQIELYQIDISHFTGKAWSKGKCLYRSEDVFAEGSKVKRSEVRKYILREHLIPYRCEFCGNEGEWRGQPMSLELDHINGVPNDHRLENLRFLCPNCHATTDTYCGKNRNDGMSKEEIQIHRRTNKCSICGKPILPTSIMCSKCQRKQSRLVNRPTPFEIAKNVQVKGFAGYAKELGVSDNAVRKWCKSYGIPSHTKDLISWLESQS